MVTDEYFLVLIMYILIVLYKSQLWIILFSYQLVSRYSSYTKIDLLSIYIISITECHCITNILENHPIRQPSSYKSTRTIPYHTMSYYLCLLCVNTAFLQNTLLFGRYKCNCHRSLILITYQFPDMISVFHIRHYFDLSSV